MTRAMLMLLIAALVGFAAGYRLAQSDAPAPEIISHMPAVTQADGSVIVERMPQLKLAPAPHQLPAGAKEERRVKVTVMPYAANCPPTTVNLSLIKTDAGRRVIASSPDGAIESALDIPLQAELIAAPPRRWAVGASYDPLQRHYGLWVERDIGRLRFGAEARENGIAIRAGFSF